MTSLGSSFHICGTATTKARLYYVYFYHATHMQCYGSMTQCF